MQHASLLYMRAAPPPVLLAGGGGGANSHIKRMGVLVGKHEKNSREVPRSCVVGMAWNFFLP